MINQPLVTVFIPVYNSEKYIADALESILHQTYTNLEVLIVNDGSTDNSEKIITSYHDSRIRLISNDKNMGIPYSRNVGLKEAKGKFLVLMDSDDRSMPNRVEKQVQYLLNNPQIDAAGSFYVQFNDKTKRKIKTKYMTPEALKMMLLFLNPIANPSAIIRLETVKTFHLSYHPDYFVAQDYHFWAELSKIGNLAIIPEFLINYRTGHENITKKSNREKLDKRKKILSEIREDLLHHYGIDLTEKEKAIFNAFFTTQYGTIIQDYQTLATIISKIKSWNVYENHVISKHFFLEIVDYCIRTGCANLQMNLKEKLTLYRYLVSGVNIQDQLYMTAKHYYYLMVPQGF